MDSVLPIWIMSPEQLETFKVYQEFRPRYVYDQEKGRYTDEPVLGPQGLPIWESEGLLMMGYKSPKLTPVKVKIEATSPPEVDSEIMRLLQSVMGGAGNDF